MLSIPTFLLAALIGLRIEGLTGLCIGACVGWVLCLAGAVIRERERGRITEDTTRWLAQIEITVDNQLKELLQEVFKFRQSCVDLMPIDAYQRLEFMTERTPRENATVWALLRRRMTERFGISPAVVDASRQYIMLQRLAGGKMPTCGKDLVALSKLWEDTFGEQRAEIAKSKSAAPE